MVKAPEKSRMSIILNNKKINNSEINIEAEKRPKIEIQIQNPHENIQPTGEEESEDVTTYQ